MRRLRRLRSDERGFTLMELLIAAGLSMVGLMAVMSTFDGSRQLVSTAERTEVASNRAERALEDAISRDYNDIALRGGTPPSSADPNHPSNRVQSNGTYLYRAPSATAPFIAGGGVNALDHTTAWSQTVAGTTGTRLNGTIYRYVTNYDDPDLAGTTNGRRVTISVTVSGRRRAVTTSTIVRPQQ